MKDFEDQDLFSQRKGQKKFKSEKSENPDTEFELDFSEPPPEKTIKKEQHKEYTKKAEQKNSDSVKADFINEEHLTRKSPEIKDEEKRVTKTISMNISEKDKAKTINEKIVTHNDNSSEVKNHSQHIKTLHELKEHAKIRKISDDPRKNEKEITIEEKVEQDVKEKKTPVLLVKENKKDTQKNVEILPQNSKKIENVNSDNNKRISQIPQFTSNQTLKKKLHLSPEAASIGHIFQEARSNLGLSQDQVAIQTKIKKSYIEALERDDFEHLPSMVYVKAYIRRLCQEYGIEEEFALKALKRHKNPEHVVPDDVLLEIEKGKQVNLEKQKRLKIFQVSLILGILLIVMIIAMSFFYFTKKKTHSPTMSIQQTPSQIVSEQILSPEETDKIISQLLITYPTGTLSELEPPKK